MNYKEKYKEALERAKKELDTCGSQDCNAARQIFRLFPELAESDGEKVRKEIINYFQCQSEEEPTRKEIHNKWIAWLEKQEGCEHIKKDWLEHIKQSWYKEGFIDGKYSNKTPKEWTINDATTLNELIDFLENGTAKLQHDLTRYANWLKIQFTPSENQGEQEKDILEDAILDGNEDGLIAETIRYKNEKQGEQKSEENKGNIGGIPPTWSDEDEVKINRIVACLENLNVADNDILLKDVEWLKSLRPQNTWKPSELQLECLSDAIKHYNSWGYPAPKLKELYEQLKKLKEGKV